MANSTGTPSAATLAAYAKNVRVGTGNHGASKNAFARRFLSGVISNYETVPFCPVMTKRTEIKIISGKKDLAAGWAGSRLPLPSGTKKYDKRAKKPEISAIRFVYLQKPPLS